MEDESSILVAEARATYFEDNGFGNDGGYTERWTKLSFGPFNFYIYNSSARRRAVPIHDLHHIVTGYPTTPKGEAQIAAWELAAGTHDKYFAWLINLPALLYGTLLWPKDVYAAFEHGAQILGLYVLDYDDALLDLTVSNLRERALQRKSKPPRTRLRFTGMLIQGIILMIAPFAMVAFLL